MLGHSANAAVYYKPEAYDAWRPRLMGRHAADESFLKGFGAHAKVNRIYCYAESRETYADFTQRMARLAGRERSCAWIPFTELAALAKPGCLFMPDPTIDRTATYLHPIRPRPRRPASPCEASTASAMTTSSCSSSGG